MTKADVLREWFGVAEKPAAMLAMLLEAEGKAVRTWDVVDAIDVAQSSVRVFAQHLRAAMEPGAIVTVHGHGYRLSPIGLAECHDAIATYVQDRRRGAPDFVREYLSVAGNPAQRAALASALIEAAKEAA